MMCVADGMGGLSAGKYYSEEAVRLLNEKLLRLIMDDRFRGASIDEQTKLLEDFSRKVFQEINQELYTAGLNAGVKGGTTLSLVIRFWHNYIIANCGDSPVYYMKDGNLHLASDIQNAAWHMVLEGRTKEGSLIYYQNKSRLLQYLGRRETVTPHLMTLAQEKADCILLGTDGVFGNLSQDQIARILRHEKNRQEILHDLFESARDEGEEDNQTAILYISESRTNNRKVTSDAGLAREGFVRNLGEVGDESVSIHRMTRDERERDSIIAMDGVVRDSGIDMGGVVRDSGKAMDGIVRDSGMVMDGIVRETEIVHDVNVRNLDMDSDGITIETEMTGGNTLMNSYMVREEFDKNYSTSKNENSKEYGKTSLLRNILFGRHTSGGRKK